MKIIIKKFGGNTLIKENSQKLIYENVKKNLSDNIFPIIVVSAIGRLGDPYSTDSLLKLINDRDIDIKDRERDLLISCGEIISAVIASGYLNKMKVKTKVLTGFQAGIITSDTFGNAKIKSIDTTKINTLIENNIIPIITGFQGISESGEITTLGRGGSDTTAVALGVALNVEKVEIFTDVDGVYTADPRLVDNASLLKNISYTELFQMASHGSKVVNPRAVELAMSNNIALYVCNLEGSFDGTMVMKEKLGYLENDSPKVVTALSHQSELMQVFYPRISEDKSEKLYRTFADENISLDLINITNEGHYFVVNSSQEAKIESINESLSLNCKIKQNVSKISCVGLGMHQQPGVFSRIITTLVKNRIEVIQTSDSHMTITSLINSNDLKISLQALHKEFFSEKMEVSND